MTRTACALFCMLALVLLSQSIAATSYAGNKSAFNLSDTDYGVRIASSFRDGKTGLTLYEVFAAIPLPWNSDFSNQWQLNSALDLSLGILDGKGETGGRGAVGIDLFLLSPGGKVSLTSGLGVGLMGKETYGDVDFSGPVFFRFQAGASYWVTNAISLGYRYYHESNGSIYDKNPSLNAHLGELRLNF